MLQTFKVSFTEKVSDNTPIDKTLTFDQLKEVLTTFKKTSYENSSLSFIKKNNPGIISGHFNKNLRTKENIHSKSLLFLDIDKYPGTLESLEQLLEQDLSSYIYIAHSTISHTLESPRIRIAIPFLEAVETKDYVNIAKVFINNLSFELQAAIDSSSTKANQIMSLPVIPNSAYTPWSRVNEGGHVIPIDTRTFNVKIKREKSKDTLDPLLQAALNYTGDVEEKDVLEALNLLPVEEYCTNNLAFGDNKYERWLKVGMGLHHYYQANRKGLLLWDEWSAKDKRPDCYKGITELEEKWEGFTLNVDGVTIRPFLKEASKKKTPSVNDRIYKAIQTFKWSSTRGEKETPKETSENLQIMLKEYNIEIKWDCIKKDEHFYFDGKRYNNSNVAINKIKSLASLNNYARGAVLDNINVIAELNRHNSYYDWVNSKPWDGISRKQQFFETVKVGNGYEELRNLYLHKWFLQMIHISCWNDRPKAKVAQFALIFYGEQGINKTSWLKSLVPDHMADDYVLVAKTLNGSKSMDTYICIEFVFAELGEITSTMKKTHIEELKNFITTPVDVLDKKYAVKPEKHRRTTVFFGTTNKKDFLKDSTGNRRFLVLPVLSCDSRHDVDMQQLCAEYLATYDPNSYDEFHLNKEEQKLQAFSNQDYDTGSDLEDKFLEVFDYESSERPNWYNATQVLEELGYPITIVGRRRIDMGDILRKLKYEYSKFQKKWNLPPKRIPNQQEVLDVNKQPYF